MKKNAFTLIEIICTVVILCLLFLFITPKLSGLINRNEEQLKKQMEVKIIDAAKEYVTSYDKTFTSNLREGDTKNINLSKRVSKEMVVYVYTNYEYSLLNTKDEITECNCPKQDISICTDKGASVITSDENKPEEVPNSDNESEKSKININTASKETLTSLSGIGDAKAQKIIDYRNENGLFKSIEELKNVSGISEKLFEQIKEFITI